MWVNARQQTQPAATRCSIERDQLAWLFRCVTVLGAIIAESIASVAIGMTGGCAVPSIHLPVGSRLYCNRQLALS